MIPLPMSRELDTPRPILIDHFLKEALQILRHASIAVTAPDSSTATTTASSSSSSSSASEQGHEGTEHDDTEDSVSWRLNFTYSMITLDTNIQTIAGLEKVIEQLSVNVPRAPPAIKATERAPAGTASSDQHAMPGFLHSISTALHLSSVFPLPKADMFRQFNSMQLMHQCVQAFVMCDGAIHFCIPRLLQQTDKVLSHPSDSKEYPVETLLVLSICTVMIRHVMLHGCRNPTVAAGLMQAYYSHARMLLQDLFDVHHITVIQSLLLLSLYPKGHTDPVSPARTRSPLLSMAIRMAVAMDLHQLDADRPAGGVYEHGDDYDDREKLRRLAWMLLCADYFAEWNASGHTGRISVTDWQVDFPRPLPGEPPHTQRRVEYLSQYSRIVMLRKMSLFGSAYRIVLRSPRALESSMDDMLFRTYMNTPASLQLNLDASLADKYTKADIEPLLLHTLYCDTLISTHIPFLPRHYLDALDRERPVRDACIAEIYQQIAQSCPEQQRIALPSLASFTASLAAAASSEASNSISDSDETPLKEDVEFHSVVGCIAAASDMTLALELLGKLDPIGCYRSPIYGALVTAHVYHMLESNSPDADVVLLAQVNLVRTIRIVQQSARVFSDSALVYLDRLLQQWVTVNRDEVTEQLQAIAAQTVQQLKKRAKMQLTANQRRQVLDSNHEKFRIKLEESA